MPISRQVDRQMGAGRTAAARAEWIADHRALCVRPDRSSRPCRGAVAVETRNRAQFGEKHFDTASARGIARGRADAPPAATTMRSANSGLAHSRSCWPRARENADDDDDDGRGGAQPAAAKHRRSLYQAARRGRERGSGSRRASRPSALRIRSAAIRCRQALAASGARASPKDPALAELVRKEQDLGKQVNAQLGALNNVLALPSTRARRRRASRPINASIDKLRGDRDKARAEINKRFPSYADLSIPSRRVSTQIKATLADGEAMLSFYFGRDAELRLGGAEGRTGCVRGDQGDRRRHPEQGAQAARGARAAGGDDLRHSRRSISSSATSSIRCC